MNLSADANGARGDDEDILALLFEEGHLSGGEVMALGHIDAQP